MGERVPVGQFNTFAQASARARCLAKEHESVVSVVRSTGGWAVLAVLMVAVAAERRSHVPETDEDMDDRADAENYRDEMMEEVRSEIWSDSDDWARSDEEGWYYGDED